MIQKNATDFHSLLCVLLGSSPLQLAVGPLQQCRGTGRVLPERHVLYRGQAHTAPSRRPSALSAAEGSSSRWQQVPAWQAAV